MNYEIREELEKLFNDIQYILEITPSKNECTSFENKIFSDMADLQENIYNMLYR